MSMHLPRPIEIYFSSNTAHDTDTLATCFADRRLGRPVACRRRMDLARVAVYAALVDGRLRHA